MLETGQSEAKFSRLASLVERRNQWAKDGLVVGFTNGCFDILHIGHLHTLEFARGNCDRLIVAINSDDLVRRLKGSERPINSVEDRARMLSALTCVDAVVVFDEDTPGEIIELLQPDVLVKGADYSVGEIVGAAAVLSRGGRVLTCPLIPDRSTTKVIERSKERGASAMRARAAPTPLKSPSWLKNIAAPGGVAFRAQGAAAGKLNPRSV